MQTRPTHRSAQTLKQAKRDFSKHGPRISSQDARRLERGAELQRRADRIKDGEKRRKKTAEKKREKEERDRETRRRMGIQQVDDKKKFGLLSQRQSFMDGFVNNVKPGLGEHVSTPLPTVPKSESRSFGDDDLDDQTLLESLSGTQEDTSGDDVHSAPGSDSERVAHPGLRGGLVMSKSVPHQSTPEAWDDMFDTNTQVERELRHPVPCAQVRPDETMPFLSTQDVSFTDDDLAELGCDNTTVQTDCGRSAFKARDEAAACEKRDADRKLMPPPPRPLILASRAIVAPTVAPDLFDLAADFDLSTQDCREIHA